MSYKKGVIPTLGFFTPQLKKDGKQGQLTKNGETKRRAAIKRLGKCRLSEKCSSSTRDTKVHPAYGRRENAKKSLVKGMQNSENAGEIHFLMANFFCRR